MAGRIRIERFIQGLKAADVEVAVLSYPVDVYYLADTAQPSTLVVPVDGEPSLLVNRNIDAARRESWIPDIREALTFGDIRGHLEEKAYSESVIGVSADVLPAISYVRMQEFFPQARLVDVSTILRRSRMIKDEDEIRLVREAARIGEVGHRAARERLRPGVSELQMACEIEVAMAAAGGDCFVLPRNMCLASRVVGSISAASAYPLGGLGVVVSGSGSTPVLPFGPSKRILAKDDVVVVDLGGVYGGYLADYSRTYVLGKASGEQVRMARALKEIVERGFELLKPGIKACEVYAAVSEFAIDAGYGEYLMGPRERNIRFVGHGVGLELDELPVLYPGDDTALCEGMVIAFEPILMIPEVALAVMENTVLITADGREVLTRSPLDMMEL